MPDDDTWLTIQDVAAIIVVLIAVAFVVLVHIFGNEQKIASDNQQETMLQSYLDRMSELLLEKNLHSSEPETQVRNLARSRTLTVLRRLDAVRKTSLLIFLLESELIKMDKVKGIIVLERADLSGIDLSDAELQARLSNTTLRKPEPTIIEKGKITLYKSDIPLHGADLSKADLLQTVVLRQAQGF